MQIGKIQRPFTKNQLILFAYIDEQYVTDNNDVIAHDNHMIVGRRYCPEVKRELSLKIKRWSLISLMKFDISAIMPMNIDCKVERIKPFIWIGYGCFVDIYK